MRLKTVAPCFFAAVLSLAVPSARAEQDSVQFFHNIEVTPDAPVGDAICFFCSVRAEGRVRGDIVVFFGNVHLNGAADQDVVDFFGSVNAADGSKIGGDIVNFFGSVGLGENVTVNQDVVAMFGSAHASSTAHVGGERINFSPWIFWGPLCLLFLVIYLIVHELRALRLRRLAQNYPMPLY